MIETVGMVFQVAGLLCFVWNLIDSYRNGEPAGDDPWDAWTLEWSTSSPPPHYNFAEEPQVHSRRPLWDLKHPDDPDSDYE
jgi:cytochrome c oxidase subunit 1